MIFKQFLSSFGGERGKEGGCDSDPPPAIVTPPRVCGTGEQRGAEREAWSSCLFVGSFSVLLNCLCQIEVRR